MLERERVSKRVWKQLVLHKRCVLICLFISGYTLFSKQKAYIICKCYLQLLIWTDHHFIAFPMRSLWIWGGLISLWLTNKSMWRIVIRLTSLMTHFRFSLKKKHINLNKYIKKGVVVGGIIIWVQFAMFWNLWRLLWVFQLAE